MNPSPTAMSLSALLLWEEGIPARKLQFKEPLERDHWFRWDCKEVMDSTGESKEEEVTD